MIVLILGLAFILRMIIANQSLWLDEAIGAIVVKTFSFHDILLKFPLSDNHPPLYYLVLKAWTLIFGYSEVALRFPSIIFGVATVFIVYRIAKEFTKVNPIIPAILLAISPLAIYYSQEARMYPMVAFLAAGAIYYFLRTFKENAKLLDWLLLGIFYTLLPFGDYVPIFLFPVFVIYPLYKRVGLTWWKKFVLMNIPLLVLGIFWLPIFFRQSAAGKALLNVLPAWRDIAGGATFKQLGVFWSKFVLGRISLFNKYIYYSLIFIASVPIVVLLLKSLKKWKENEIFWMWLVVPVVLGFFASVFFPVFIYFRFIFVLPAFYLLIASGKTKLLIYLVIVFNIIGWGIYVFDGSQHREDWRAATIYVKQSAKPGEIALFENPEPFAPYRWYWDGGVPSVGSIDSISADPVKTRELTKKLIQGKSGVYYFEYLKDLEDPQGIVQKTLGENNFKETGRVAFNGVGFVVHYRTKGNFANGF
jgi:4-amino-4-deoxy-L-arabinose transferase-like glycosyltransferase